MRHNYSGTSKAVKGWKWNPLTAALGGAILAIFLAPAQGALANTPDSTDVLDSVSERLFQWGEYDSLIRVLEPVLARGVRPKFDERKDSIAQAKLHMYLGVAYFSVGRRRHADKSLHEAHLLDPGAHPDVFYLSGEAARYFHDFTESLRLGNATAEGADAVPTLRRERHAGWMWWSLGGAALVAGGASYVWINRSRPPAENITQIDLR